MRVKVKEGKDSKGKSGSKGYHFSVLWVRGHLFMALFHVTLMGSQPHDETVWKVTEADMISFLVIFVAVEQLVCKSPRSILSWYLGNKSK